MTGERKKTCRESKSSLCACFDAMNTSKKAQTSVTESLRNKGFVWKGNSQKYSFIVPSVILDTQMATKSDVFSSYFGYSVFIPRVTFLVELQIQLHTPVKSNMIIILLKINLLDEI